MAESVEVHAIFTKLTLKEDYSERLERLIRRHVKEIMTEKDLDEVVQGHKASAYFPHGEGDLKGATLLCHCGPEMVTTLSNLEADPELTYILLWELNDIKGVLEEESERMETSTQEGQNSEDVKSLS